MKRYRITSTRRKSTGTKADNVYSVIAPAKEQGVTWTDIAATVKDVPQIAIHSYLHALRKAGFIETVEAAVTSKEKEVLAQQETMRVRNCRWKCPTCKTWTTDPMGRSCTKCRKEKTR